MKDNINLAEKYRVHKYDEILYQDAAVADLIKFISEFPKKKGCIIHGPAGTGKTSLALAAARENNFDILELNASDLRNRAKLEEVLKPATLQESLFKKGKILLMDEVDGVTGSDIGGIPELIKILETTKFPIIMTCNDVWQSKLSSLRSKCKLIEMKALKPIMIINILKNVLRKENLQKSELFLKQLAIKSQGDLRAALNDLQSYALMENLTVDTTEKRNTEETIFNILRRVFKERQDFLNLYDSTKLSLDEILLWLEENIPHEYKNESLAKAYDALANADVFRGRIYKNQSWRFLIYQNIFQSAGIAYAKKYSNIAFTKYETPKRILKIWINKQKSEKKKTISKKYARLTHCAAKTIMRDFSILKPILNNPEIQKQMRLSPEEIDYLKL